MRTPIIAAVVCLFGSPLSAAYIAHDLYTLQTPVGFSQIDVSPYGQAVNGSSVVGRGYTSATMANFHALLWNGNGVSDLNPPGYVWSALVGTDGAQQVGAAYKTAFGAEHPILWNGTAQSAIDLSPTNLPNIGQSGLIATSHGQQVGLGYGPPSSPGQQHALLWNGTPGSAVDLNPTNLSGIVGSEPAATDGVHQVGWVAGPGTGMDQYGNFYRHAVIWSGSANTAVDLHPTQLAGFTTSEAEGVYGTQIVGDGYLLQSGEDHPLLWNGTADSAVDLQPTKLGGFSHSFALATNGINQVGWGYGPATGFNKPGDPVNLHALIWTGTPDSAIDLNTLLPGSFVSSQAFTVDSSGDVFGTAMDSSSKIHAIEWAQVPEPQLLVPLLAIAALLRPRRLRVK